MMQNNSSPFATFEKLLYRSWWFFLFIISAHFSYASAIETLCVREKELHSQLLGLQEKHRDLIFEEKELKNILATHEDPVWGERALMRILGLCPKQHKKIFFRAPCLPS